MAKRRTGTWSWATAPRKRRGTKNGKHKTRKYRPLGFGEEEAALRMAGMEQTEAGIPDSYLQFVRAAYGNKRG